VRKSVKLLRSSADDYQSAREGEFLLPNSGYMLERIRPDQRKVSPIWPEERRESTI